jgi:hypothetical protein
MEYKRDIKTNERNIPEVNLEDVGNKKNLFNKIINNNMVIKPNMISVDQAIFDEILYKNRKFILTTQKVEKGKEYTIISKCDKVFKCVVTFIDNKSLYDKNIVQFEESWRNRVFKCGRNN